MIKELDISGGYYHDIFKKLSKHILDYFGISYPDGYIYSFSVYGTESGLTDPTTIVAGTDEALDVFDRIAINDRQISFVITPKFLHMLLIKKILEENGIDIHDITLLVALTQYINIFSPADDELFRWINKTAKSLVINIENPIDIASIYECSQAIVDMDNMISRARSSSSSYYNGSNTYSFYTYSSSTNGSSYRYIDDTGTSYMSLVRMKNGIEDKLVQQLYPFSPIIREEIEDYISCKFSKPLIVFLDCFYATEEILQKRKDNLHELFQNDNKIAYILAIQEESSDQVYYIHLRHKSNEICGKLVYLNTLQEEDVVFKDKSMEDILSKFIGGMPIYFGNESKLCVYKFGEFKITHAVSIYDVADERW